MFFPMQRNSIKRPLAACLLALALLYPRAALALESEWMEASHGQVRLLADSGGDGPRAAIEIRIEKGWKTYWRYPGDDGVPPHFDWSGAANLDTA